MADQNLKYKIGITLIKGIGNSLAKNLIAYLGSEEAVFSEKEKNLAKIPGIGEVLSKEIVNQQVLRRADEEVEFILKKNIATLYFTDKAYPYRLKECSDSPIMLYTTGNCDVNAGKFIAVVGTRNATATGKDNCKKLIQTLSQSLPEAVIVSGLAYGIDICAHKAALESGLATMGVVAHGLDRIYPVAHRNTAVKILENGLMISEFLSGTNPDPQNFVRRNRIVAGMCDAVIVVESAVSGGALITANLANDYNRDVFAFPGRVDDVWSGGCNALIKSNKAALIETADDLLKYMSWQNSTKNGNANRQQTLFVDLNDDEQGVIFILRQFPDGLQLNDLSARTAKSVGKVSSLLLEMEFKGVVKCYPGNLYKAVK
jgi:DNA processing protein